MQIKQIKGLSLLLATVSCISLMGTNVFAETGTMKVSAKRVSEYSITIPSTLSLTTTDKQNFTGTYTVGVKGDVAANDTVYLRPQNASFEMVGKADSNNKSTASVTQTKTEWRGSEIDSSSFTETTGDVEVEITHADEYEGDLVFDYGIEINLQPGLYDADNNLLLALTKEMVETNYWGNNYKSDNAVKVVFPDSVTSIGEHAFDGCTSLASVTYKGETYTSKSALKSALTSNGVSMGYGICENTGLSE